MERLLELETTIDHPPLEPQVLKRFEGMTDDGTLGFMKLPFDRSLADSAEETAAGFTGCALVVDGIGGSALGARCLLSALGSRGDVTVVDSPDPSVLAALRERLDPSRTAVAVMTKSGSTAETMAVFLDLWNWLDPACRDSRIIAVTDPERGDLRRLAADRGWPSLPVPPSVGGRYSVFSPVGLLPGAFAGWDLRALLGGAAEAAGDLGLHGPASFPGRLAACWLSGFRSHPVHVLFTYSDLLADTADWFAQLWAESLGKRLDTSGREVRTGQTPLPCRGPADQHSLVQLFMEGPRDKFFTFLTVSEPSEPLPGGFDGYSSIEWLEGRTLDELRLAEARATEAALAETGAPTCSVSMSGRPDERRMGALLMSMEIATVLCGIALGIDPLDQPGVERGKQLTFRRMGRPGWR